MTKYLTSKDIKEAKKIKELFFTLSEKDKMAIIIYLSTLKDKEIHNK